MEKHFKFHKLTENFDVWEDVEEELWQWEAIYTDGTVLKQFDTDTPLPQFANTYLFHQFKEIDQTRLQTFRMVSPRLNQYHCLLFDPQHMKLIHRYLRSDLVVKIYKDKENNPIKVERKKYTSYVFGYETLVKRIGGDVKIQNFIVIMPNGELITTNNLENIRIDAVPREVIVE